ncbi:MAG: ABC transporter permease [Alphaproteobacteria bacterium]|nr:ABC transporter permease [Alphaproteobacteria bacterium]
MSFFVSQVLTGLAGAATLFLVASGLSLIFGVTRIVNFAHGSLYMLGAYLAYLAVAFLRPRIGIEIGFWLGIVVGALAVGLIGVVLERAVLRRLYRASELFQLLATFAIALVVQDLALAAFGPEDLLGPPAPGFSGAVRIMGRAVPEYDLFLMVLGPLVLIGLTLLLRRTRWGILVRAATEDREMTAALGVNQSWLFTGVFFLGATLAGLGGALQLPRQPANLGMDMAIVVEAFVVTVVGGMGSIAGAFVAAILIGQLHAFGILAFPNITIVLLFLFMAAVLIVRPWGLFGQPPSRGRRAPAPAGPLIRPLEKRARLATLGLVAVLLAAPALVGAYYQAMLTEILIFALFAASLQLLTGIGGMVSFGHAAYFGLGAYGAALSVKLLALPMAAALWMGPLLATLGAMLFGWFCVRLAGVYLAMLTLAFAQICFAIAFQWYGVTGGDNGLLGIWPSAWAASPGRYYYLVLGLAGLGIWGLRQSVHAPFGYGLRAGRDAPQRAEASGIDLRRQQWLAFVLAGAAAGLAGGLHAFFKGSVFPDTAGIALSVDGLVMMLLGGIETLSGPLVGALLYKALHIFIVSQTDYWRLILGGIILALVTAFPHGVVGYLAGAWRRPTWRRPSWRWPTWRSR